MTTVRRHLSSCWTLLECRQPRSWQRPWTSRGYPPRPDCPGRRQGTPRPPLPWGVAPWPSPSSEPRPMRSSLGLCCPRSTRAPRRWGRGKQLRWIRRNIGDVGLPRTSPGKSSPRTLAPRPSPRFRTTDIRPESEIDYNSVFLIDD